MVRDVIIGDSIAAKKHKGKLECPGELARESHYANGEGREGEGGCWG